MEIIKSSNKKDFMNNKYNWKFVMSFRLNTSGEVDNYYEETLEDCNFWLETRSKGDWLRYKNIYYFDHMNDMLMFTLNFGDHIKEIYENNLWNKKLLESKKEVDVEPLTYSNIIEIEDVKNIDVLNDYD